ncbi:MAG: sensor histidine kinase [Spirochaetota bacterium]
MPLTVEALFHSENIPIIEIDAQQKVLQVGKALQMRMPSLIPGDDVQLTFPNLPLAHLLGNSTLRSRINLYKEDISPISHDVFAVKSEDRTFLIFEPVIDDIQRLQQEIIRMNNDLSNAMREIQKKNAELSQLNALKNEFLGMAAHDLRTPIANIYSFSDLALLEADRLDAELLQYLTEIKALAEFMMELLSDLLDITVIESGNLHLKREDVSLTSILESSIKLHTPMAVKKRVRIATYLDTGEHSAHLDSLKVAQVCNNLINNAIKFSPSDSEILVNSGYSESECWFEVKDNGPGIDPSQLAYIFDPFRKGSLQAAGNKGHGLGLAISKKIVDAHGGRLQVQSAPGEGSVFRVVLPAD